MTRIPAKFSVKIKFLAGPWGGAATESDSLDPIKVILDNGERVAHAYVHQNDGDYLYSPEVTAYLSRDFAGAVQKWGGTTFHVPTG